ncbi:early transcription elongation factor of RNA pol II, NGN section-domain-containing protein [Trichophaea hybrida]|nr:early transcription elongation factor of RNA pol II, NGN section-domain-containing protein [Trichophaea hybrida]
MEAIAEQLKSRHGRSKRGRGPDSGLVPRRLLLPAVTDPNIWGVKCRPGKEKEVIFSVIKRMEELEGTKRPMPIISAFEREAMQGYIYVEAYNQNDVIDALNGISNAYPRSPKILVPIKEMPDLLNVIKTTEIVPGTWVRLKRGKYQGDLAQVENVLANGLEVRIRLVPRLDYGQNQDRTRDDPNLPPGQKRKRSNFNRGNTVAGRPPQRLFSEIEAVNVNPTLEEVAKFASTVDEGPETLDLNALAASLKTSVSTYQVGDTVEVYDGEQQGVIGKAVSVHGEIVTMDVIEGDLKGKRLEVPFKGLRKRFREGDHVKVTGGRYRDEIGTVVRIMEDKVTLIIGEEMREEITVFSKDLREATEGGSSSGKYDLHDLVQLDYSTVACVIKIDKASLRVLEQNGDARTVISSQVVEKIHRRNAVATDRNGSEIRVGDTVKEIAGNTRTGIVLHIYRAFVFLHNREQNENSGVFVCRATNVATIVAKGGRVAQSNGPDLTKMNPAMLRNGASGGSMMPPPARIGGRDKTIGQTVNIRQGPYKGLMGIIKDATDNTARVELHTKSKTITIEKMKLGFRDSITGVIKSFQDFVRPGGGRGEIGFRTPQSANTPSWSSGSRTPQVDYSGSRTPAWMAGGGNRTPAWMMNNDGGRTPAYVSGGKTPAWGGGDGSRSSYQGNRTPAWNPSSRTPYIADSERSAWDAGSKTPGRTTGLESWGADTSHSTTARTPGAYNAASPEFLAQSYGGEKFFAPTPGNPLTAPTPSAPTPGPISAPTPAGWGVDTAPTPGASGGYGRGSSSAFPNTPGVWGADDEESPRYAPASP